MKDKFLEFAKTPLGTAIAIGLYCLIMLIYILSKTSFGQKAINSIKYKFDYLLGEFKKHKEETEKALEEQNKYLKKQLEESKQELEQFKTFVVDALKYVNNKKIQQALQNYELRVLPNKEENKAQQG